MKSLLKAALAPIFFSSKTVKRLIADMYEGAANSNFGNNKPKPALKGWSVIVPTDGTSTPNLKLLVDSLDQLDPATSEIIIIAPPGYAPEWTTSLPIGFLRFKEMNLAPGWITRKKNLGVAMAKYDKVVVCHDYIEFLPGWKQGFDSFGDDFEVCMNRMLFLDGRRTRDWVAWDYPNTEPGLLPYDIECSRYQYINGTYFVVKRDFFLANPLDEKLRWGEGEDVEWSLRVRNKIKFKMNPLSTVRFSKPKPVDSAPYCENWVEGTTKLAGIFGQK